MGKGDKKSRKGKISSGSFGKTRRKKTYFVSKIPVSVLDQNEQTTSKIEVRQEVGFPNGPSENLDQQ